MTSTLEGDTRANILSAAGELFAESGFERVTVRQICRRAGANVAAVNYHFGDKLGLYMELVLERVRFADQARLASTEAGKPEDQLQAFVHRYLAGLIGDGQPDGLARIIAMETARPSPVLKRLVKQVIRPTEARLRSLVGQIVQLPEDDAHVRMSVHSIIGQCLHYKHAEAVIAQLWPELWQSPNALEQLSAHIVNFSLAGLRDLKRRKDGRSK